MSLLGILIAIFYLFLAWVFWRFMRAHEDIAQVLKEIAAKNQQTLDNKTEQE